MWFPQPQEQFCPSQLRKAMAVDHHLHLQPTPRKKILTPGFWKCPADSSGLINSGLLHYWETGLFLLKPGKKTPMFQRGGDAPKPSRSTLWNSNRPHFLMSSAHKGLPWCQHTHSRMCQEKPW